MRGRGLSRSNMGITRASCRRMMPRGAVTRSSCRRLMPQSRGITAGQMAQRVGVQLRKSGVKIGRAPVCPSPGANLDNYKALMKEAGYNVVKESLRRLQQLRGQGRF